MDELSAQRIKTRLQHIYSPELGYTIEVCAHGAHQTRVLVVDNATYWCMSIVAGTKSELQRAVETIRSWRL